MERMGHTPSTVMTTGAPAVLKIGFPYFENKSNTIIFSFLVLKKEACTLFQVIAPSRKKLEEVKGAKLIKS